jgi:hypothetical protein
MLPPMFQQGGSQRTQSLTPPQAAEALFALLPRSLTQKTLDQFGLSLTTEQAQQVSRELLALNLYWIQAALTAHYKDIGDVLVLPELHRLLRERWTTVFRMPAAGWRTFLAEADNRRRDYQEVAEQGGGQIDIGNRAVARMESDWVARPEQKAALLSLIVDLVPMEAIGKFVEALELIPPPEARGASAPHR